MDHLTVRNRLSAYMDGELPPDQASTITSHLASCPACASELASLQSTSAILRQFPTASPSPDLLHRLHAAIDTSSRRPIERFIGLLSGIAACLALIAGLMLLPHTGVASTSSFEVATQMAPDDSLATDTSPETAIGQWMVSNVSSRGELP